jgi:Glycosyl hydrolases family 43
MVSMRRTVLLAAVTAVIVTGVLAVRARVVDQRTDVATSGATTDTSAPEPTAPVGPDPAPAPEPDPSGPGTAAWPSWSGDRPLADPGALYAAGAFHVYGTTATMCPPAGAAGDCAELWVPRFTGPTLATPGTLAGDAMPDRPPWVAPEDRQIWAPTVAPVGDGFVLYFAATAGGRPAAGLKCLGAAVAPTPAGPFVPDPLPLRCTPGYWNLDPAVVDDPAGGGPVLLWREDDRDHPTGRIVAARLAPGGRALAPGEPATLVEGEQPWEDGYPDPAGDLLGVAGAVTARAPFRAALDADPTGIGPVENPAMARHPATGEWLLTWSANRWETHDYATGLATCDGPLGPCRRVSEAAPWLRTSADPAVTTSARFGGTGGLSFVGGPDGELYAVLHAYRGEPGDGANGDRVGWAYRVAATPDGYRLTEF